MSLIGTSIQDGSWREREKIELSIPINLVPTQYANNPQNSNSAIDLIFLQAKVEGFNNHHILSDLYSLSDHTSLLVSIIIKEEVIQDKKWAIVKNGKKEQEFINELRNKISSIDMTNILSCNILEPQEFTFIAEELWYKYSKFINITKCSKVWQKIRT